MTKKPKKMKGWIFTATDINEGGKYSFIVLHLSKKDEKFLKGRIERVEIKFLDL